MCPFARLSIALVYYAVWYGWIRAVGHLPFESICGMHSSLIISCPFLFFKHKKRDRSLFFLFFLSLSISSSLVLSLTLSHPSHHSQPSFSHSISPPPPSLPSLSPLSLSRSFYTPSFPSFPSFLRPFLCCFAPAHLCHLCCFVSLSEPPVNYTTLAATNRH